MAKQYKVRKKCLICKNVFYPSYAGSLYCNDCKNKKTLEKKKPKPVLKAKAKSAPRKAKPAITKKKETKKAVSKKKAKK
ncbi:MAG: hypothetical protein V1859_04965 [archaeon]